MCLARQPISRRVRFLVLQRDNFTCQYCGARAPEKELEVDHAHPVSRGGLSDLNNLVTACFTCNRGKGKYILTAVPLAGAWAVPIVQLTPEQIKMCVLVDDAHSIAFDRFIDEPNWAQIEEQREAFSRSRIYAEESEL